MISVNNLSKRFGNQWVLRNLSLELHSGECTFLLGNNGSGKTTLLRLLLGLSRPTSGSLQFDGIDYQESLPSLRQHTGCLLHESHLYQDLTVAENLTLFGKLYQVSNVERAFKTCLEEVGLGHTEKLPVRALSSGMTRRVVIAKLLMQKPKVLILDEPFNALDQQSVTFLQNFLKQHQNDGGTILLTTHQFSLGLELAQRVIVLQQRTLRHDQPNQGITPEQCAQWLVPKTT